MPGTWELSKNRGDTYYIEIYNNVEYAEPVEYGHRNEGSAALKKGRSYVGGVSAGNGSEASRLPAGLVTDFLNTHDWFKEK